MRIVQIEGRPLSPRVLDCRAQINRCHALCGEVGEKHVVFGRLAWILRPKRQVVLVDGGRVGRHCDQEADSPRLELVVHAHEHLCRLGHPLVAKQKTGALTHRFLAEKEHAPIAPDKHQVVAEAEHRFGQFPMRRDQLLSQAEMVFEIGVDRCRQCKPIRRGRGQPWRRRKGAPFPENARGTVRRDQADHERRGEHTKSKEGENPTMAQEHQFSFTTSASLAFGEIFWARWVAALSRFIR